MHAVLYILTKLNVWTTNSTLFT